MLTQGFGLLGSDHHSLEGVQLLQDQAGATNHRRQWILGDIDRHHRLVGEELIQPAEQGPAAGQDHAPVHDVGDQFRWRLLEGLLDRRDDRRNDVGEGLANLDRGHLNRLGQAGHEVAAADVELLVLGQRVCGAHRDLDVLGGAIPDQKVEVAPDELDDALVHLVAADADRLAGDDAAQRDDGDLAGATANVDDHRAGGLPDRQAGPNRGRHRLLHQVGLAAAGVDGGVGDGALLDLGDTAGDAQDGSRAADVPAPVVHLGDEVLDHLLGDVEVGDVAVFERAHGDDVSRGPAEHLAGLDANRQHHVAGLGHGHDRGFVEDDPLAADVHQSVGGTEVDPHVGGPQPEYGINHAHEGSRLSERPLAAG